MYEYRVNSRPPIVIYIDYNHLKEKKIIFQVMDQRTRKGPKQLSRTALMTIKDSLKQPPKWQSPCRLYSLATLSCIPFSPYLIVDTTDYATLKKFILKETVTFTQEEQESLILNPRTLMKGTLIRLTFDSNAGHKRIQRNCLNIFMIGNSSQ